MCCIVNDEISSWYFNNNVNCNVFSGLVYILCLVDNKNYFNLYIWNIFEFFFGILYGIRGKWKGLRYGWKLIFCG